VAVLAQEDVHDEIALARPAAAGGTTSLDELIG
jgi:hypothetical protein